MAIFTNFSSLTGGNQRLNINTDTAKGLEKAIGIIAGFVISAQSSSDKIFYGKYALQGDPSKRGIAKAIDKGIINLLKEIASFDFCNIINYTVVQAGSNARFNPSAPPENPEELAFWKIQNLAFKGQVLIDKYYAEWGTKTGQNNTVGLLEVVNQLNLTIDSIITAKGGLGDPDFKTIPGVSKAANYLENVRNKFKPYTNSGIIPQGDISNVIDTVDKIRMTLVAVQAFNNPAAVLGIFNRAFGGVLKSELDIINQWITPGPQVVKLLKEIIRNINNINSVARKIIGYINLIRIFIKLLLFLIKIFYIVRQFLTSLPLPAAFVPTGVTTTLSQVNTEVVKDQGINKFVDRLSQLNAVVNLMLAFVTSLVSNLTVIINSLELIILNIQNCNPDIAKQLEETLQDAKDANNELKDFLNKAQTAANRADNTFGGYTIEIVTEELVDEGIKLKRRYGIARGGDGIIAVQSTPTFASLDLIIVNEVKVLLVSQGFVKSNLSSLSSQDLLVVMESMNYLGEEDISLQNLQITTADLSSLSNAGEIGSFFDNLPGGKAFRKKVRNKMAAASKNLQNNLKSTDPSGKYSNNIIKG